MNAFAVHCGFDFRSGLRNPSQLLMNYLFPLGVYAILGLVMSQINPLFRATMIPAMVLLVGMGSFVLGFPGPLVESRDAGVFRSFRINGIPASSILLSPILTTTFHFFIASALVVLTAEPIFGGAPPTSWGGFVIATLAVALCYSSLGTLFGVVSSNSRVTMLLTQLVFLPSMLIGGLMVPLSMLPSSIRSVAFILPTSHLMQLYTGLGYGQPTTEPIATALVIVGAGALLAFLLSVLLFSWDRTNGKRRLPPLAAIVAVVPYLAGVLLSAR